MKSFGKKITALVLAALFLWLPAGCADGAQTEQSGELSTEPEQTSEPAPTELDFSSYPVVRPDTVPDYLLNLYLDFYKSLKEKTGANLKITGDFVKEGTPYVESEYEILLGPTNRKETRAVMDGQSGNYYAVTVRDKKIVISGNSRLALGYALNYFLNQVVQKGSTRIPPDLCVCGEYEKDEHYPQLEGIRLTAIGDSYFGNDPEHCWLKLLADDYKMHLRNYGIGGSTLSNYVTDRHPMTDRWSLMANGADVVILEGGRNDFNVKAPLGDADSRDPATVAGAINTILDGLQKKYPEALILCVTAWYVNNSMQPYVEMMKTICKNRGIPCFDASNQKESGVYMNDAAFRAKYCIGPNDVSHLNPDGMLLVEPVFERFIALEYEKFLAAK